MSMDSFDFDHFVGFDWAKDRHDIVMVDLQGRVVENFQFEDSAEGWDRFRRIMASRGRLAVAVETRCGPAVERLLQFGVALYPIQPMAAKRYRERKKPSGVKTNFHDAWSLADALRMDGHGWRRLQPDDALTQELRLLCRDEVALIENRTALVNQLQAALYEYYPAALEAFDDWTKPATWAFVLRFSTPEKLVKAGRTRWEKFLRKHRLARGEKLDKRMEVFSRATAFAGTAPVTAAKSLLTVAIARQLVTLEQQLDAYRRRIEELFAQHPDHDLFGSLPGAAGKLAPRLLAEIGANRDRFDSPEALQCYAGTAPVSFESGRMKKVHLRRACNKFLRSAVHLWTNLSRPQSAWSDAFYKQKRSQGKTHACALRCLGQRWLKIVWKMWQTGTPYNEALHTLNQTSHGSWVLGLTGEAG